MPSRHYDAKTRTSRPILSFSKGDFPLVETAAVAQCRLLCNSLAASGGVGVFGWDYFVQAFKMVNNTIQGALQFSLKFDPRLLG